MAGAWLDKVSRVESRVKNTATLLPLFAIYGNHIWTSGYWIEDLRREGRFPQGVLLNCLKSCIWRAQDHCWRTERPCINVAHGVGVWELLGSLAEDIGHVAVTRQHDRYQLEIMVYESAVATPIHVKSKEQEGIVSV